MECPRYQREDTRKYDRVKVIPRIRSKLKIMLWRKRVKEESRVAKISAEFSSTDPAPPNKQAHAPHVTFPSRPTIYKVAALSVQKNIKKNHE